MSPIWLAVIVAVLTWTVIMPVRFSLMKNGRDTPPTLIFKGIPTAAAAAFAIWAALSQNPGPYAQWMALGLLVCLAADVVLDLHFVIGGGFFLLGHVCYVIGLTRLCPVTLWHGLVFVAAMVVLQGFVLAYRKHIKDRFLAYGVCVYAAALAALLAAALPLPFLGGGTHPFLAAAGALLFVLSDATLCDNMINRRPLPNQYVSLGIYYTAQLLLGLSTLAVL